MDIFRGYDVLHLLYHELIPGLIRMFNLKVILADFFSYDQSKTIYLFFLIVQIYPSFLELPKTIKDKPIHKS